MGGRAQELKRPFFAISVVNLWNCLVKVFRILSVYVTTKSNLRSSEEN